MSVAFPSIGISGLGLELNENLAAVESIFTRQRQITDIGAGTSDRWQGTIRTPTLYQDDVNTLFTFLVEVGLYGQFTVEDPDYTGPLSGLTSGSVVGAGQSGTSLIVDGFPANTLILRKGERFQVRTEYKMCMANATSNGSGQVTFTFKPALRVSPANNDTVTLSHPLLLCELLSVPGKDTNSEKMGAFTIAWQEALVGV